ncbi:MAG TPA: tetratricopeptide repeat protein [Anaeromyxobacter sp.]|nr:tetratricopeptide repeat protein [Anaeromyxobacter sp.]
MTPMLPSPAPSTPAEPALPPVSPPRWLLVYAVTLAAVLPYLGSIHNPPILDDGWTAINNPLVWKLENVPRIFQELYGYAGPPSVRGPYRPLTTLSFALNYAVHQKAVLGYHLVNIALHAIASLLVAALAGHLARAVVAPARAAWIALAAGLLFAVHPSHAESVVTIFGRTEPLSAVFALWALLLALRARRARGIAAAAFVLMLGILSKEVAVTIPPLYLLIAYALPAAAGLPARPGLRGPEARRALGRAASVACALGLAFLPYLVGHTAALHEPGNSWWPSLGVKPVALWFPLGTPRAHVLMTMSRVLAEYLRILALPAFLGGDFAYAARIPTITAPTAGFAIATAAWALVLAAGVLLLRRAPLVAVGVIWIFVALLPVLHVFVPVGVLLAERLLYLPSVGFCLAAGAVLGGALSSAFAPREEGRARAGASLVLAGFAALAVPLLWARTAVRTEDWSTTVRFWESEVRKAPLQVTPNNNLAVAYTTMGQPRKAIERLEVVLAVDPRYWRAWVNLGIARGELGEFEAGRAAFEHAIRLAPDEMDPPRFLGRMLAQAQDLPGAIRAYERARRIRPEQAVLARELAQLLLRAGRTAEARAQLEDVLRLDPGDGATRALLGRLR